MAPEDLVRRDLTSGARVVAICQECGHDDMAERVRAEAEEST